MQENPKLMDDRPSDSEKTTHVHCASLLKRLLDSPGSFRKEVHRDTYWRSVLAVLFGNVENFYRLQYSAAPTQSQKSGFLRAYFRDFPESAGHSDWTEERILELWRMGDRESLADLKQIIDYREKPKPFRVRMRTALQGGRLAAFDSTYEGLTIRYRSIKEWIKNERIASPRIKRVALWNRWVARKEEETLIDQGHFFKLASTDPRNRHCTPAYVARSYLRELLRLPDRLVSRPRASLKNLRIQYFN